MSIRRDHHGHPTTCPVAACPHAILHHDIDETPGLRVERCQVPDCGCVAVVGVVAA